VYVFSRAAGRQNVVAPLVDELRLHTTSDAPLREVQVSGHVRAPGPYPLEAGMRISDLIRAGGGLAEQAYSLQAELTRYSVDFADTRQVEVSKVDLGAILRGDTSADVELTSHDYLVINRIPDWDSIKTVTLTGEVTFPGQYRILRGETLGQLLQRAGGLTDQAYPEGAIFLRESLRQREQQQIGELTQRLEEDLATLSLQEAQEEGESETLSTGRALLAQLRETPATGRLVIDLAGVSEGNLAADIELREGDRLLVPEKPQAVTVIGQTQQNTSHLYQPGLSRQDYIELSGGLTRRADKKLIYVVRASGAVISQNRSRWLGRGKGTEMRPGDTIVVPLDVQRIRPLTLWTSVTQILYQAAIAVAAVDSFSN
jgi:protein involved in polysaccharide export with SLBB domain